MAPRTDPAPPRPRTSFGYTIVYVEDVSATMAFYTDAFGLEPRFVTPEGDYGELETGPTTLAFVALGLAEANLDTAGGFTRLDRTSAPPAVTITLVTDDVGSAVSAALAAGARRYVDASPKPWGQVVAYVVDPNGVLVEVATPVAP